MSQLRNDLLERIKERHDQWFEDAIELYDMGRLRPYQCANDAITVMTYQIVFLLEHYGVDIDEFIKALKRTMTYYRKESK